MRSKALLFAILIATTMAVWVFTPLSQYANPREILSLLENVEPGGPALGISLLAFAIGSCVFIPVALSSFAVSIIFPLHLSFIISFVGVLLAATSTYHLGRMIPVTALRKHLPENSTNFLQSIQKQGFLAVLILRIAPTPPFTMTSILAGSVNIGFRDYLIGTMIGILPLLTLIQIFGSQAVVFLSKPSALSFSIFLGVLLLVIGLLFVQKRIFRILSKRTEQ